MNVTSTYADLHDLVDRLTPEQADAVRTVVGHLVNAATGREGASARAVNGRDRIRRLSFAGTLRSGKGDLAARSEDIIRAELDDAA